MNPREAKAYQITRWIFLICMFLGFSWYFSQVWEAIATGASLSKRLLMYAVGYLFFFHFADNFFCSRIFVHFKNKATDDLKKPVAYERSSDVSIPIATCGFGIAAYIADFSADQIANILLLGLVIAEINRLYFEITWSGREIERVTTPFNFYSKK